MPKWLDDYNAKIREAEAGGTRGTVLEPLDEVDAWTMPIEELRRYVSMAYGSASPSSYIDAKIVEGLRKAGVQMPLPEPPEEK